MYVDPRRRPAAALLPRPPSRPHPPPPCRRAAATQKIDCKKCELDTFRDWVADDVPRLQQLLVEVHEAPVDKVLPFLDVLEAAGYLRFHKEPNIQWNTKCLEYAFFQVDTAFMNGTRPG